MNTNPDIGDVLLKAASLVEQGWCQNTPFTAKGGESVYIADDYSNVDKVCLTGAIEVARYQLGHPGPSSASLYEDKPLEVDNHSPYLVVDSYLREAGLMGHSSGPIDWNDEYERKQEEVADALRGAADYYVKNIKPIKGWL